MMEGSGSVSGSVPLTNGSGRPKNFCNRTRNLSYTIIKANTQNIAFFCIKHDSSLVPQNALFPRQEKGIGAEKITAIEKKRDLLPLLLTPYSYMVRWCLTIGTWGL